jgi:hypothetical protein
VSTEPIEPHEKPRGTRSLWAAVIGTPVLWAAHLTLTYALVPPLCRWKRVWILHVITLTFLALSAAALSVAGREWGRLARRKAAADDVIRTEEIARTQFLAVVGVMTSTFFFIVILATGIPAFVIDPCQE